MRILAPIPHYFDTQGDSPNAFRHGSLSRDPAARIEALSACVSALRQMFDAPQVIIDIATGRGVPVNQRSVASKLDIVVCTTRGRHLLPRLSLPPDSFLHHPMDSLETGLPPFIPQGSWHLESSPDRVPCMDSPRPAEIEGHISRVGPTTPTRPPGLPLARCRLIG